jgi:AcrR family transcriptional regulator
MSKAAKFRPRTKAPERRRDELMNAAQRLFLKKGVGATTVEEITSGADVAKGTFYLYFSSKEDVLAALGNRFGREHLMAIKAAIAEKPEAEWREKLGVWARACATTYLDSIELHDIVFYGARPRTREGLVDNIVIDDLVELLQGGVEAGVWTVEDPRFTGVFLFSGLHSVVDDAYSKEKRVNRSRLASRLERLFYITVGLPVG